MEGINCNQISEFGFPTLEIILSSEKLTTLISSNNPKSVDIFSQLGLIITQSQKNKNIRFCKSKDELLSALKLSQMLKTLESKFKNLIYQSEFQFLSMGIATYLETAIKNQEIKNLSENEELIKKEKIKKNFMTIEEIRKITQPSNDLGLVSRLVTSSTLETWNPDYTFRDYRTDSHDAKTLVRNATNYLIKSTKELSRILGSHSSKLNTNETEMKLKFFELIYNPISEQTKNGEINNNSTQEIFSINNRGKLFIHIVSSIMEFDLNESESKDDVSLRQLIAKICGPKFHQLPIRFDYQTGKINPQKLTCDIYYNLLNIFHSIGEQDQFECPRRIGNKYSSKLSSFSPKTEIRKLNANDNPQYKNKNSHWI